MSATLPSRAETFLDEQECRDLLGTQTVGRVAFTERALPVIYPAHFVVDHNEIILAALPDGRVSGAQRRAVVAFEVDTYDPSTGQGWCVSTVGHSRLITDTAQVRGLDSQRFSPWAENPDRHYIAIEIGVLRGKKLTPTPQAAPTDRAVPTSADPAATGHGPGCCQPARERPRG